ncbi:MAG TPA: hypothetical protein DCS04_00205 [Ruminococcaceae bacterium]|nr:hypothetical protein [Oscillospiraceae bacterium]
MAPKVSIIIPSYNEEKNISRCLDSVLNQTFTDFEILCVDDGSKDNTFEIIKNYSEKDSRIIPLKNPDKGVSSARNFGIENASGKYIGFIDSDDFIQPQMYEFLYRAVTENNCDFSVCRYKKTSEVEFKTFEYKTEKFEPEKFISFYDADYTINNELVFSSACTKLISKNFLGDIRFKNYKIGEDTVFNSEIYSKSDNNIFIDAELYDYYINMESATSTQFGSSIGNEKWYDLLETRFVCYDILKNKNKIISAFYFERGMKSILSFRFDRRRTQYQRSFKNTLKKYLLDFLKCDEILLKTRLVITLFLLIPPFYTAFRKMTDKTL